MFNGLFNDINCDHKVIYLHDGLTDIFHGQSVVKIHEIFSSLVSKVSYLSFTCIKES